MAVGWRWLALALACAGCDGGDVDVVVDLRTDLVPGVEFTAVEVVFDGGAAIAHVPSPGSDYVGGVRIADASLSRGNHSLEVRLVDGVDRVIVQPLVLNVDGPRAVTVVITRDCRGVTCPGTSDATATACLGGRCIDPGCSPETPESCPPPLCTTDGECEARDACSTPRCSSGACLYEDRGNCAGTEYCDPEVGCLALPSTPVDAGTGSTDGFEWAVSIGSTANEFEWQIARTDTVIVAAGTTRGALVSPEAIPHGGSDDAVIVGLDPSGAVLFTRAFATPEIETIVDIAPVGTSGDFVVTGSYFDGAVLGSGEPALPATGRGRTFVLRISGTTGETVGTPLTIGGDDEVWPQAMASTESGNVVLALRARGNVSIAGTGVSGTSPLYAIFAEVDPGSVPNARWIQVIDDEDVSILHVESSGTRALFLGSFTDPVAIPFGDDLMTTNTTPEGFAMLFAGGAYQWGRTFTSTGSVTVGRGGFFGTSSAIPLHHEAPMQVQGGPSLTLPSAEGSHVVALGPDGSHLWSTPFFSDTVTVRLRSTAPGPGGTLAVLEGGNTIGTITLIDDTAGTVLDSLELTHSDSLDPTEVVVGPPNRACLTGMFRNGGVEDRLQPIGDIDVFVGCARLPL